MSEFVSKCTRLAAVGSLLLSACAAPAESQSSSSAVVAPQEAVVAAPSINVAPPPTLPAANVAILNGESPGRRLVETVEECNEVMQDIQRNLIAAGVISADVSPVACKQANFTAIGCQMIDSSTVACNFDREEAYNLPNEVVLAHEYCHAKQIPFSNIVAELQCATFEVVYSDYDVTARGSRYRFQTAFLDKDGNYFSYYPYQFAYDLHNLGVSDEDLIRFAFDPRTYDRFKDLVALWLANMMVDTEGAAYVEWVRKQDSDPANDYNNPGVLAVTAWNYSPVSWHFTDNVASVDDPCNPFKEGFETLVREGWCQFELAK